MKPNLIVESEVSGVVSLFVPLENISCFESAGLLVKCWIILPLIKVTKKPLRKLRWMTIATVCAVQGPNKRLDPCHWRNPCRNWSSDIPCNWNVSLVSGWILWIGIVSIQWNSPKLLSTNVLDSSSKCNNTGGDSLSIPRTLTTALKLFEWMNRLLPIRTI